MIQHAQLAFPKGWDRMPASLPRPENSRAVKIALAFAFIFSYFLLLSFDGLRAYFTSDDGMNLIMMHNCFTEPLWRLGAHALQVCTPAYRPMGGLFYRIIYAFFHFDPLPFRVACYGILTLNLILTGLLLRCLSGSWEIAAVGTLLFSYHGMLVQLFYNTGTVYDLLCATFYLIALLFYIYARSERPGLTGWQVVGLLFLYCCALDSKEMAASFPLVLIAYELIYYGVPTNWSIAAWRRFRAIAILVILTCAFTAVKVTLPSPMTVNALYQPGLSPHLMLHNLNWYFNLLLYRRDLFSPHTVLLVVAFMFLVSWWMRSVVMLFGLVFSLAAMLPVLIIAPRDSFVLYLPLIGWSMWAAVLLLRARVIFASVLFARMDFHRARLTTQVALLICLAAVLYPIHQRKRNDLRFSIRLEQSEMRDLLEQMKAKFPVLPHDARILFIDDPFEPGDWGLSFLLRLEYADPTLVVARMKDMPNRGEMLRRDSQYLFAYRQGLLTRLMQ
jgi:hypothetical protein